MTAAGVHDSLNPDLRPAPPAPPSRPATTTGKGRVAVALQLAITVAYGGGVVVPALITGVLPVGPDDDSTRLWSESGSAPANLMHILGFFAATVGIAVTVVCLPVVLTALVRGWRQRSPRGKTMLIAAALLGVAFLAFSATPSGRALRACIAD